MALFWHRIFNRKITGNCCLCTKQFASGRWAMRLFYRLFPLKGTTWLSYCSSRPTMFTVVVVRIAYPDYCATSTCSLSRQRFHVPPPPTHPERMNIHVHDMQCRHIVTVSQNTVHSRRLSQTRMFVPTSLAPSNVSTRALLDKFTYEREN